MRSLRDHFGRVQARHVQRSINPVGELNAGSVRHSPLLQKRWTESDAGITSAQTCSGLRKLCVSPDNIPKASSIKGLGYVPVPGCDKYRRLGRSSVPHHGPFEGIL